MNVLITQNSQNLSHSHTTNSQSTSTTGGISGNNYAQFNKFTPSDAGATGRASITESSGSGWYTNGVKGDGRWSRIDLAHTHSFAHTHNTDSNGGAEARPVDFTYKIWCRIA